MSERRPRKASRAEREAADKGPLRLGQVYQLLVLTFNAAGCKVDDLGLTWPGPP